MRLIELVVDDLAELLGFTANSLVSSPAHESPFYAFKEEDTEDLIITEIIRQEFERINGQDNYAEHISGSEFSFASQDQQIVVGPLLIPQKRILRIDESGNPYEVFFTEETIRTIGMGMMRDKLLDELNLEHDPNQPVSGFMVSSWFVEDPKQDTALAYGFKNLVKGSWYGMYKVEDPAVWQKIKNKEVTGFSIEAYLAEKLVSNQ